MTETTFTPRPWSTSPYYIRDQKAFIYGMAPDGVNRPRIAVVEFGVSCGNGIAAETEANARLIAAAPELYAGAEAAVDILESYIGFLHHLPADELERHPYIPAVEDAFDMLFAALAKARGEQS
jgi:hypothetical protein